MSSERTISVLDGSTFIVGDRLGDLHGGPDIEHGFFSDDTRFVSRWILRAGPQPLRLLGLDQDSHYSASFISTPVVGPHDAAPFSVRRRRLVDQAWVEEVTITNHRHERLLLPVTVEIATDFADLFEVKDGLIEPRDLQRTAGDRELTFSYHRDAIERSVTIVADREAEVDREGFTFRVELEPGETWSTTLRVTPHAAQPGVQFTPRVTAGDLDATAARKAAELDAWLARAPRLETDDPALERTYRASLSDLAALRLQPELVGPGTLPAAGLPWFMALFGRDSIITSLQALPYLPGLAATTLGVLASRQAVMRDDFHEQEPGKILHELRFGELTARGVRPHSPYFGSADATPLFLVLLDEYHRWTGDDALVRALEPHARAALAWIDESGDADGDGYVEYACRNSETGLVNQCWKDSWDAIQFADGTLARGPIATSEIQGYVYDARRRMARLAREVWGDPRLATRLDGQADDLRERFRRDFLLPERGCHALALDGDKRPVDSLTSNIGHLLWSGIVGADEAAAAADLLLGEELYSGWGVRTLGSAEAGYNPLGYHTGTVWPHDNALVAAGLARYGHHDAARTIAGSILAAAPYFEHRLPEVFAGYPVEATHVPVAFPTASRPQAWAAGTPLMLLTTVLRLEPGDDGAEGTAPGGDGRVALRRTGRL